MVGKIYRNILVIQVSITFLSMLGGNIDNIIVGKFMYDDATTALAACGLVAPVVQMASVISGIITTGIKTVCSRSIGEGNRDKANLQISTAAIFSVVFFTVMCVAMYCGMDSIASGLAHTHSGALYEQVKSYMMGYLLVIPPLGLLTLFIYILQINNKGNYCVASAAIFIIMNTVLDLVAIFVMKNGLFGIGLSTAISYFVMIGVLLVGYFRVDSTLHISFRRFSIKQLGHIFRFGITNAIATGSSMILKMIINSAVLSAQNGGSEALAAVTVLVTLSGLLLSIAKGLAYCTDMTSGMFYGERNVKELKNTIKTFVTYSLIFNIVLTAVIAVFSDQVILLFMNQGTEAYRFAVDAARLFSLCLCFYSIADCFVYFYLGIKKPHYSYIFALIINLGVLFFSVLLIPKYVVMGVATSYVCGYLLALLCIIVFFCIKNKSNPFKLETYLALPENFEIDDKYILEVNPKSKEEVLDLSTNISDFCKRFDADIRTRMAISLAIEELGVNVFDFGVQDKKHYIYEVRVIFDPDSKAWIVRMRDDCKRFNPIKFLHMNESDDKESYLGIKLVNNMSKNVDYHYTLGLNNITVEI